MKHPNTKHVIGVAGEIASGTTTFAKYAEENFGANTYRFSIPLRDIVQNIQESFFQQPLMQGVAKRLYLPIDENTRYKLFDCIHDEFGEEFRFTMQEDRDTLQRLSTALRTTFGEDCLAKAIFNDLQISTSNLIVVEGVRRLADIEMLRKFLNFTFVYVEASLDTRFNRVLNRKQYADEADIARNEFIAICKQESESRIRGLKRCADVVIVNNTVHGEAELYGLARYYEEIDSLLRTVLSSK